MVSAAPTPSPRPSLIVSDVDGTCVTSADRITPRLRRALRRFTDSGGTFLLASGRPARWMLPVVEQLLAADGLRTPPTCICANGAVIYDAALDRVTHASTLAPPVVREIVATLRGVPELAGRIGFGVERVGRSAFDCQEELFAITPDYAEAWESVEHSVQDDDALCAAPVVKLLVSSGSLGSAELYALVAPHVDPTVAHATYSWGGGLVEISAPGVTKQSAIARLAADWGIDRADIAAFGDMPNDLEMLQWVGQGVAMGNADARVQEAADRVTDTNDDDGVAKVMEEWLGSPDE